MAKEFYDWVKLVLDNKWLVMLFFTSLGSMVTNANQYFIGQEDDQIKSAMKEQITVLADTYIKPKEIIVKSTCSPCGSYGSYLNKHLKEYHE